MRPADASSAIVASHAVRIRKVVITALAARESVMLRKISMTGNPVGLLSVVSRSPIQKSRARRKAKPMVPLMASDPSMQYGTATAGLFISSPRWIAPSYPIHVSYWIDGYRP